MVFLAELERLPVGVGDELARGETLAIRERGEPGVLLAARLAQIRHQLGVELLAAFQERFVIGGGLLQQRRRVIAVAPPIRAEFFLHVLNRELVVMGEHQP